METGETATVPLGPHGVGRPKEPRLERLPEGQEEAATAVQVAPPPVDEDALGLDGVITDPCANPAVTFHARRMAKCSVTGSGAALANTPVMGEARHRSEALLLSGAPAPHQSGHRRGAGATPRALAAC